MDRSKNKFVFLRLGQVYAERETPKPQWPQTTKVSHSHKTPFRLFLLLTYKDPFILWFSHLRKGLHPYHWRGQEDQRSLQWNRAFHGLSLNMSLITHAHISLARISHVVHLTKGLWSVCSHLLRKEELKQGWGNLWLFFFFFLSHTPKTKKMK